MDENKLLKRIVTIENHRSGNPGENSSHSGYLYRYFFKDALIVWKSSITWDTRLQKSEFEIPMC